MATASREEMDFIKKLKDLGLKYSQSQAGVVYFTGFAKGWYDTNTEKWEVSVQNTPKRRGSGESEFDAYVLDGDEGLAMSHAPIVLSLSQDAAVRAGKMTRKEALSLAEALPVLANFKKFSKTWAAVGSGIKDLGAVSDAGDARYLGEMVLKACDDMKSEMQKLLVQLSKEARGKS